MKSRTEGSGLFYHQKILLISSQILLISSQILVKKGESILRQLMLRITTLAILSVACWLSSSWETPQPVSIQGVSRKDSKIRKTTKGCNIIASVANNTLIQRIMAKGKILYKEYPIATGGIERTPTGNFFYKSWIKCASHRHPITGKITPGCAPNNPTGRYYMPLIVPGRTGIAIHGTTEPQLVTQRSYASMGCIRMRNEDMEQLLRDMEVISKKEERSQVCITADPIHWVNGMPQFSDGTPVL